MNSYSNQPGAYQRSFTIEAPGAIGALRLPHLILVGEKPGPCTAVTAGQHGREVTGMLAAGLVFRELDPAEFHGVLHVFPNLNPIATLLRQQDYPLEAARYRKLTLETETNLDRLWGNPKPAIDPLLPAIAEQVWEGCLAHCDQFLDLHGWSEFFCPLAWAHERDSDLLAQTGYPWLVVRGDGEGASLHTLREKVWSVGKPVVVVELGGQNTVSRSALNLGQRTIRNFLTACGHWRRKTELPERQFVLRKEAPEETHHAKTRGLWHPCHPIGEPVGEGDLLGEIFSLETFQPVEEIRAGFAGLVLANGPVVWGEDHREHQVVFPGQRLARIQQVDRIITNRA